MAENPKAMLRRGFCPACGHRMEAHALNGGCGAHLNGEECWCPLVATPAQAEVSR